MKEIKIVTAFFDINRGDSNYAGSQARSNQTYFNYFDKWASIHNDLLVYCAPQDVETIKEIREKHGRKNTLIIPVENIYTLNSFLFERMFAVEKDSTFQNFRARSSLENTAKYDYLMFLKYWFLKDAAFRIQDDCVLAWVDFGWGHDTVNRNFDYLWEYNFEEGKIYVGCNRSPETVHILPLIQSVDDCMMGDVVILNKSLCSVFYDYMEKAVNILLEVSCIDDDQTLLMMVYRWHPELFNVSIRTWFKEFEEYS